MATKDKVKLPQTMGQILKSTCSTASTGVVDIVRIGNYSDVLGITAVCSSGASVDIEATTDPMSDIDGGTAIWVPVTGLTAVSNTAKQAGILYPITGLRMNVKTGVAGTLTYSIVTSFYFS